MQRVKHADRKQRTRALILIGAAAERAGAADLDPAEIEAVLAHYVATGGSAALKAAVAERVARTETTGDQNSAHASDVAGKGAKVASVRGPVQ